MADFGTTISLSRELSQSDESSSDQSPKSVPSKHSKKLTITSSSPKHLSHSHHDHHQFLHHNTVIEIERKPKGRPPGSKNKPKPPVIITKDSDPALKPAILEISVGSNIIHSIINYACKNNCGISVISATGSVSNVNLRHPHPHAPPFSLPGPFNLLSLSGSYLGSVAPKQSPSSSSVTSGCFGISLAGPQGQVFGGIVAGKVFAASPVVVVATTFVNPSFQRLPIDDQTGDRDTKPVVSGPSGGFVTTSNEQSKPGYIVANPTPINCHMSPPEIMHWPGHGGHPSRPHY